MQTRTTTALLDGLADPANEAVWREFDARYRPILFAFGRRLGLSAEDAADAAQETLLGFIRSYRDGRYERGKGRLSGWIIGIARHCIRDLQRAGVKRAGEHASPLCDELPDDEQLTAIWEHERDRAVLQQAMERLHEETAIDPRTIEAFDHLVHRAMSPADVANLLGMTPNDVYLAKHRCLKRLRGFVSELTDAFETDG